MKSKPWYVIPDDIMCKIEVKPEDLSGRSGPVWDEWVFAGAGAGADSFVGPYARSRHWSICMHRFWCSGNHYCQSRTCLRCPGDYFNAVRICRAEKGTRVLLYDNSEGNFDDDSVEIVMLQDFNSTSYFTIDGWNKKSDDHCLKIENLERSADTEYYRMTYRKKNGLNGKVSNIALDFPHRGGNGR